MYYNDICQIENIFNSTIKLILKNTGLDCTHCEVWNIPVFMLDFFVCLWRFSDNNATVKIFHNGIVFTKKSEKRKSRIEISAQVSIYAITPVFLIWIWVHTIFQLALKLKLFNFHAHLMDTVRSKNWRNISIGSRLTRPGTYVNPFNCGNIASNTRTLFMFTRACTKTSHYCCSTSVPLIVYLCRMVFCPV